MRFRTLLGITGCFLAVFTSSLRSQTTGSISGRILDSGSGAPVSAAQVFIPQLQTGSLTQANGRYALLNVPAGVHTLQVQRIGYRTTSAQVTVTASQVVVADFTMVEDVLALDEIVVTGATGQARRREVGNTISQLRVDDLPAPSSDVGSLLQGRMTGVSIGAGSGSSGSGADIRLRGNVSVVMSNSPLIYIDGVRVRSEPYSGGATPGSAGGGLHFVSALNDLNPNDIERIEIVKGPAATTLYGTEGAAGVIQVFTKRGSGAGAGGWTIGIQQGIGYAQPFINIEAPESVFPGVKYGYAEAVLRKGLQQQYNMSFSGGGANESTYFISAQWSDQQGVVLRDSQRQLSIRGNVQFKPGKNWSIDLNNNLTTSDIYNPPDIFLNSVLGNAGDKYRDPRVQLNAIQYPELREIQRHVTGVTITYSPFTNFTHRVTLGHDNSQSEQTSNSPFGRREEIEDIVGADFDDRGSISRMSARNTLRSFDYTGTLSLEPLTDLRTTLSFGLQGLENAEEAVWATGSRFPGPGDYTVSSAEVREALQAKKRVITGGFFLQDMLAFKDRYFLTLGLRVDGNSAFGEGFGLQSYPKASLSYVISDESFWPEGIGSLKLRGAYGWAGRAPGAFDAVRTWDPVGFGTTQVAFGPLNVGNPNLGPERTRELEVGFDGSFFSDRLTAEFTYYDAVTKDALLAAGSPPSLGGWPNQIDNLGTLRNWGKEISVQAKLLALPSFGWDLGAGVTLHQSKVISLGGGAPFLIDGIQGHFAWLFEDEPVPVYRGSRIENYWEKADPIISTNQMLGPGHPPRSFNLNTTFSMPGGVSLTSRADYEGGHWGFNHQERLNIQQGVPMPQCYAAYRKVDPTWTLGPIGKENLRPPAPAQRPADMYAWEWSKCYNYSDQTSSYEIKYFQLREITMSIPVSNLVPGIVPRSKRTDMAISWRNPWYWRNRELMFGHPDQWTGTGSGVASTKYPIERTMVLSAPPASYVTVTVRTSF